MTLKIFKKNGNLTEEERTKLENEKELEEYNRREEKYNDILRDQSQKQRFKRTLSNIKINTYTKKLVAIIMFICLIDLQFTYALAFMGKTQIAETLSTQICITILGVAFVYMIRAYFDSKAEHKNLDQKIIKDLENTLSGKINDAFNAAGINLDADEYICKDDEEPKVSGGLHININSGNQGNDNSVG